MKRKKILIILFLFTIIYFIPFEANIIKASPLGEEKRNEIIRQIEILQDKVKELLLLISNLNFQKEVNARSYVVFDISKNSVILEKNKEFSYPVASITKLMGAVVALENIDMDKTIVLSEKMLEPLGYSPSLFLGLRVSAKNLLKASLIQSTNDAANSLAYFLEDGDFLELMNKKAKELNMKNTFFYDPHGLSPSNVSSANDISKLLIYIYENHPEILEISRDNNFWLPNEFGRMLKFKNVNNFYNHSLFIGGKTGYLPEARQTFAAIFNIKENPVAIVLLYSQNRQEDTLKIIDKIKSKN